MARALSIPPTNKAVYMAATDSPPTSPYSLASPLGPYMTGKELQKKSQTLSGTVPVIE
jgi:hypothetical protein